MGAGNELYDAEIRYGDLSNEELTDKIWWLENELARLQPELGDDNILVQMFAHALNQAQLYFDYRTNQGGKLL